MSHKANPNMAKRMELALSGFAWRLTPTCEVCLQAPAGISNSRAMPSAMR
ncbi:hypothetical protein GCM10009429_29940 [Dyella marensis]